MEPIIDRKTLYEKIIALDTLCQGTLNITSYGKTGWVINSYGKGTALYELEDYVKVRTLWEAIDTALEKISDKNKEKP